MAMHSKLLLQELLRGRSEAPKEAVPGHRTAAEPESEPYRLWDVAVPQLFLRVQPSGVQSGNVQWHRSNSRALEKWPGVTIEAARTQARKLLTETAERGVPLEVVKDSVTDACRGYVTWLRGSAQ